MAGNSVPIWPNKAIKFNTPAGLDIAIAVDGSPSMGPVKDYVLDETNIVRLETQLRSFGVGLRSANQYTYQGFNSRDDDPIEIYEARKHFIIDRGFLQLSVPGQSFLDNEVETKPNGGTIAGGENPGRTVNYMAADVDRFVEKNDPLFIVIGDEMAAGSGSNLDPNRVTEFDADTPIKYRYVGCMPSTLTYTATDPSEDPVPAGDLWGHVWVNETRGLGIYFDGNTIHYRKNVLNSNLDIRTPSNVWQRYATRGADTFGAIYRRSNDVATLNLMFESIGKAFGELVYDPDLLENQ